MIQYVFPFFGFIFILAVRAAVATQTPLTPPMDSLINHQAASEFVAYHAAVENYVEFDIEGSQSPKAGPVPGGSLSLPPGMELPPGAGNDVISQGGGWAVISWYRPAHGQIAGDDPAFGSSAAYGYAVNGIYHTYQGNTAIRLPSNVPQDGVVMSYVVMSGN